MSFYKTYNLRILTQLNPGTHLKCQHGSTVLFKKLKCGFQCSLVLIWTSLLLKRVSNYIGFCVKKNECKLMKTWTRNYIRTINNRLGQISRKPAILNFCRQTRGKVGKHTFLDENYALNTKKLFTRPDFEFLTVKLQLKITDPNTGHENEAKIVFLCWS